MKVTVGNPHKPRLDGIHSLAMLKMEKNFIAHNEKGYPRQPYNDERQTIGFLIKRLHDELEELHISFDAFESLQKLPKDHKSFINEETALNELREECADISNLVDYLFEKLTAKLIEGKGEQ